MKKIPTQIHDLETMKRQLESKETQIIELKQSAEEFENKWKRALADYQNLEKRVIDERNDFVKFAARTFVQKLLTAIDDLEKAAAHVKDTGLNLALKKVSAIFKEEGIEKLVTLGQEFDIQRMEAIQMVQGDKDNKIVQETRPGYVMHGAVIRPAQVIVSKKSESFKT